MSGEKQSPKCRICGEQITRIVQGLYHQQDDKWSHHRCIVDLQFKEINRPKGSP
jgi:hypothetical protein